MIFLPPRTRLPLALIAVLLTVMCYYWLSWGSFAAFFAAIDHYPEPFVDYVVFYSEMGKTIFTLGEPAKGFYYSPAFALVLGLLELLGSAAALWVWVTVLILGTFLLSLAGYQAADPPVPLAAPFLFIVLTSFPVLHNFKWAQASLLLVLFVMGSLVLLRRGSTTAAGILLTGAVAIKYYPVLFLLPIVFRRRWSGLAGFGAGVAVFLLLVPAAVLGWDAAIGFYQRLAGESRAVQVHAGGANSQYAANVFMRLLSPAKESIEAIRFLLVAAGFLVAEFVVVLIVILRKLEEREFWGWAFVLLFLAIPFMVATSWPHYLVFYPFCQLFLLSAILRAEGVSASTRRTLSGMVGVSVFLSSVFAFQLAGSWQDYNGWGLLFWSDALMLAVACTLLVPKALRLLHH